MADSTNIYVKIIRDCVLNTDDDFIGPEFARDNADDSMISKWLESIANMIELSKEYSGDEPKSDGQFSDEYGYIAKMHIDIIRETITDDHPLDANEYIYLDYLISAIDDALIDFEKDYDVIDAVLKHWEATNTVVDDANTKMTNFMFRYRYGEIAYAILNDLRYNKPPIDVV